MPEAGHSGALAGPSARQEGLTMPFYPKIKPALVYTGTPLLAAGRCHRRADSTRDCEKSRTLQAQSRACSQRLQRAPL
jgi:hypothetical protein